MNNRERPWEIGIGWDRDERTAPSVIAALKSTSTCFVGENEPYGLDVGSDFTIPEHAMARGLAHLQLEFRNDLVRDPRSACRYADILFEAMMAVTERQSWHRIERHLTEADGVRGAFIGESA